MWYVIQVRTGHEEKIALMCRTLLPSEIYEECFIPRFERLMKQEKKWTKVQQVLFPGYIFIITEDINSVKSYFGKISELTKVLGDGVDPIPISEKEEEMLRKFGKEEHVIEVSRGVIVNDKVVVMEGPMKDFTGKIKRIDRHKRVAVVEIEMFGRATEVKVGMEIVSRM